MKSTGLDKILGRVEDLDSINLAILVQRLARERKLQETVFNTIQDGIVVIDTEGVVQYANAAACGLIGLKPDDIGGVRIWKIVPDIARFIDPETIDSGRKVRPVLTREVELNYPEHRFIRLYMVPMDVQMPQNGNDGYVIVLSDVTEDKVSMEELIESERVNSIVRLAAGVAHELGNPLNSLTIHLQLIERKLRKMTSDKESGKLVDSLQICQKEVQCLDGIITHFLEAVRPQKPELNDLNLIGILEEVLHVQEAELVDRQLDVNVSVPDAVLHILGDRGQVKQVFFNVIKNAMEAMEPSGKLNVRTRSDDAFVYMQFIDTGSGISEKDLPGVFQAYYTTKKEGHGLGMMIAQRIMRDHGGKIGVESRKGAGTVITLQFPQPHSRTRCLESDE